MSLDKKSEKNYLIYGFRKHLLAILILSVIISFLEAISLGSVSGLVYTIINDGSVLRENKFNNYFDLSFIYQIEKKELFKYFIIIILLIFLLKNIIKLFSSYYESYIIKKIYLNNSINLFSKYIDFQSNPSNKKNFSEIHNDISSESIRASKYISSYLILLREIILIMILISGLLIVNFELTIYLIVSIFCFFIIIYFFLKNKPQKYGKLITKKQKEILKSIIEPFELIKFITVFNKKHFFQDLLKKSTYEKIKFEIKQGMLLKYPTSYFELCFLSSILVVIYFLLNSEYDTDKLISFIALVSLYFLRLIPSFVNIYNSSNNLRFYKNSKDNVLEKLKKLKNNQRKILILDNFNELKLKNISFNYLNKKKLILKKINIKINKGKITGIFGKTGIGKSTLVDIILGLIKPNKGEIFLNKKKIQLHKYFLKNFFSYVPQKSYIINGSIKENIALAIDQNTINKKKIIKCLKIADAYNFVKFLPKGINYICKDGGKNLSGGQSQRLAIARALYFDSEIIIFDESTSSLDQQTEEKIFNNLSKMNKTIIFISHNLKLKKFCNQKYILN
tara:strand:+ start:1053 stop:2744 length:1692 start_codon:yes stop_codon:yes gene_type:complete